jgi:hypothetical protein
VILAEPGRYLTAKSDHDKSAPEKQ